jgi:NADH-quinone oxidoreductase subunit G/NADP-reducing hydrogenase subunit HndD
MPSLLPDLSTVKSPQQITGALIKTLVASQSSAKAEKIFSVSVTPCTAMKFEARRDGMMRKGISDVDSVLTIRELARLIRLYGIDITNAGQEPADEPMEGRSSVAALAEVSGGMAEGVIRSAWFRLTGNEAERQMFKKLRGAGNFREAAFSAGIFEISVAVVDGLTGLEKLKAARSAGRKYDLVEVMTCPGGCVNGAGLALKETKEERKNRTKMILQADESDTVSIPEKSPVISNLYEKLLKENRDISDKKIFYTHFEKRNVLL